MCRKADRPEPIFEFATPYSERETGGECVTGTTVTTSRPSITWRAAMIAEDSCCEHWAEGGGLKPTRRSLSAKKIGYRPTAYPCIPRGLAPANI
jgi:hypothetical protein